MDTNVDWSREQRKLHRLVRSKFQDYLGRQYLHSSFDNTGGRRRGGNVIPSFEVDQLSACKYHCSQDAAQANSRYNNPGIPGLLGGKGIDLVYAPNERAMMMTRAVSYHRVVKTAEQLLGTLPVDTANRYYNTWYLHKSSRNHHRVLHEGAVFNYESCVCKKKPVLKPGLHTRHNLEEPLSKTTSDDSDALYESQLSPSSGEHSNPSSERSEEVTSSSEESTEDHSTE